MEKKHWKLGSKEAKLVTYTSGPNNWYRVRILWSNKLGLELQLKRDITHEEGVALVARINKRGSINTSMWKKDFFPYKGYLSGHND